MAKTPVATTKAKASGGDDARLKLIRERAERAREFERENTEEAIRDLEFRAGMNQWPQAEEAKRVEEGRPVITENRIPQFVRQVTGDMRQMKPAMKAYPVDDGTDVEKAELVTQVLRYIESRSDATDAYFKASDSQVACGIGHWRIVSEYCDDEGDAQDLLIQSVDDQVNVLWDPDATKANREDAAYCFVPVDMTLALFKERYPKAGVSGFDTLDDYRSHLGSSHDAFWCSGETIRVAEYWERKETKDDKGRKTVKVTRSIVTGSEVLEGPTDWPGKYIPIVPLIGEEVRIGGKVFRHGVVRFLRPVQQRLNYFLTAETEVVALQPKAPFMVTETQVEDHQDEWNEVHRSNRTYVTYTPDPKAPGAPQRVQPAVSSQGILDGIQLASDGMYSVTGIYPSALGGKSNETSGKAILARQREGDVGTYVYINNFERALKHTGRILVDLIQKFYDTARILRIFGEDGAMDEVRINQPPQGVIEMPEWVADGEPVRAVDPATDLTLGKFDVIVQAGPSYTTKREEARETLKEFMADPQMKALLGDLYVGLLDVPAADKWSKRLKMLLPPPIQRMEAEEEGARNGQPVAGPMPPPGPPPEVMMQQMQEQVMQSADVQMKQADIRGKELDLQRRELDMQAQVQTHELKMAEIAAAAQAKQEAVRLDLMAQEAKLVTEIVARQQAAQAAPMEGVEPGEAQPDQSVVMLQEALSAVQMMLGQLAEGQAMLAQSMLAPKQARMERAPDGAMIGTVQPMVTG